MKTQFDFLVFVQLLIPQTAVLLNARLPQLCSHCIPVRSFRKQEYDQNDEKPMWYEIKQSLYVILLMQSI